MPSSEITERRPSCCQSANGARSVMSDLQASGIELLHRGLADPGIGLQPVPHGRGIEKQQRGASVDAADREDFVLRELLAAGNGDRGDAKSDGVGGCVAGVAQRRRSRCRCSRPWPHRARPRRTTAQTSPRCRGPRGSQRSSAAIMPVRCSSLKSSAVENEGQERGWVQEAGHACAMPGSGLLCLRIGPSLRLYRRERRPPHPLNQLVKCYAPHTLQALEQVTSRSCRVEC